MCSQFYYSLNLNKMEIENGNDTPTSEEVLEGLELSSAGFSRVQAHAQTSLEAAREVLRRNPEDLFRVVKLLGNLDIGIDAAICAPMDHGSTGGEVDGLKKRFEADLNNLESLEA